MDRGTLPGVSTPAGAEQPPQAAAVTATFSARVLDSDGNPVSGAQVSVNGISTSSVTDSDGAFTYDFTGSATDDGAPVHLAATKNGYIPAFQTARVFPENLEPGHNAPSAEIVMAREPATLAESTQASITRGNGAEQPVQPTLIEIDGMSVAQSRVPIDATDRAVTFSTPAPAHGAPPDVTMTIGDPEGTGPGAAAVIGAPGTYIGSITYGDPTDMQDLALFPGEFYTESDTGRGLGPGGVLITAGFARITLANSGGEPITQFAPGTQAHITMRVPAGVPNPETGADVTAGDTVPVFIFNETTGQWIVEHNTDNSVKRATVQQDAHGLFVEFTTTHLTWFNLDYQGRQCPAGTPTIHIVDTQGNPVTGAMVYAQMFAWVSEHSRVYNESTFSMVQAPADIPFKVWAEKAGQQSEVIYFDSCKERNSGLTETTLVIGSCEIACRGDAECEDGVLLTRDTCVNPGMCSSVCQNTPCESACSVDTECEDDDQLTIDTCQNPGTCEAQCSSEHCSVVCSADSDCNDDEHQTIDTCENASTCEAACTNTLCGMACISNGDCDDDDPLTIDTCANKGTCDAQCINEECAVACTTDAGCDDSDALTIDTCTNASTCDAMCINTACPIECVSNSDCNDGNMLTVDVCFSPGTCVASCSHTEYPSQCNLDSDCDDGDPVTTDTCAFPGTYLSTCKSCNLTFPFTVLSECYTDTQCSDGNSQTTNHCANTECGYFCIFAPCERQCRSHADCDDYNPVTEDFCAFMNSDLCNARCGHISHWHAVGTSMDSSGITGSIPSAMSIKSAVDASGKAYVVWEQHIANAGYGLLLKHWNGSAWVDMPSGSSTPYTNGILDMAMEIHGYDIAVNSAGIPYVAWAKLGKPGSWFDFGTVTVKKWDGSNWQPVPSGGEVASSGINPRLAFTSDDSPVVAWCNDIIHIRKWNGSSWEAFPDNTYVTDSGFATNPVIKLDSQDYPVVMWVNSVSGTKQLFIKRWNGNAWVEFGIGSASGGGISADYPSDNIMNISMVLDSAGNPIVAWQDLAMTSGNSIHVIRWNGVQWEDAGLLPAELSNAGNPDLAVAADGKPVLAWVKIIQFENGETDYQTVFVKKYDGMNWVEIPMGSASGLGVPNRGGIAGLFAFESSRAGTLQLYWINGVEGANVIYGRQYVP